MGASEVAILHNIAKGATYVYLLTRALPSLDHRARVDHAGCEVCAEAPLNLGPTELIILLCTLPIIVLVVVGVVIARRRR
jgi:hypothetical protein